MDKKRRFLLIISLLILIFIMLGIKWSITEENSQVMNLHSGGDDNSHWFHLTGIVFDKTSDTLLIELNDTDESISFFDTSKVSLDCTKCKKDLEQISEGDVIKFYFFKYNIDNGTVKAESIVKTK